MKKLILLAVMFLVGMYSAGAQTTKVSDVKREGKTFIANSSRGASQSKDIETSYNWQDKEGNTYPIYLHKYVKGENAGQWTAYVIRKSKKTGKAYKYNVPNGIEIASMIISENPNIIKGK